MTGNSKQLVAVEQERTAAVRLYGDKQEIVEFGYAVKRVAPWAKEMQDHDIGLIVRRALALGLDPLNPHEVQIWVDKRGNVQFQLSYTLMAEWVRHCHGEHTEPQFEELDEAGKDREGLVHGAMAFRASFIMKDDIETIKALIDAGFPPEVARQMVTVTGLGVAFPAELSSQYFAPAGRSPAWKVQKRALVDAYRRKFGTPTREQIMELRRVSGRDQIEAQDWIVASYEPEELEEAAKLEAMARAAREMTDDEKRDILERHRVTLHGPGADWDEPVTAEVEVKAEPEQEPEPAPEKKRNDGKSHSWPVEIVQAAKDAGLGKNPAQIMGRLAKSEVLRPDDALDVVLGWLQVYDQARKAGSTREQAAVIADGEMDFSEDATQ